MNFTIHNGLNIPNWHLCLKMPSILPPGVHSAVLPPAPGHVRLAGPAAATAAAGSRSPAAAARAADISPTAAEAARSSLAAPVSAVSYSQYL